MPNKLHNETSPYLRQHQHNPVAWYPWGKEALSKAVSENKLILVSIGYSACHWCHVMERESFENDAIAEVMNKHFVSIKVDREERPDIDQIYMIAVQLMTNSGGWPLNCICLPDGRPIYGGTYFRPSDWKNVLLQLADMWRETPEVAFDYAERLTKGIQQSEQLPINRIPETYSVQDVEAIVTPWKRLFDKQEGGHTRVPKFPMPSNWLFLLRYGALAQDKDVLNHVHFTLRKIASGGIYDHVGGGFARYSVDGEWHIPHFEKMLYDNAQLVSLYAEAWQQRPTDQYKRVVAETLEWVRREMTSPEGGFYCALDADSEGVEGKFYIFHQAEIEEVLGEDAPLFIRYFSVSDEGNWEEERTNVLKVDMEADKLAQEVGFSDSEWEAYLAQGKQKLLDYRNDRVHPGLDNKLLTSWNALMLKGFVDAYRVFDDAEYLEMALGNAEFLRQHVYAEDGGLLHQPASNGKTIAGFLDDYAFCIEAYIALYEATFEEVWLEEAKRLMEYVLAHFYDKKAAVFYYASDKAEQLIARKQEIMDNVIPSSSSSIVRQLYRLGLVFDEQRYKDIASQALANVFPQLASYGSAYSNWATQLLEEVYGCYEIVLTGPDWLTMRRALDKHYLPNKMILGGTKGTLPLLAGKMGNETQAYVCKDKTCSMPTTGIDELMKLII
ncbi:thioredoxin domain-containing protein [Parapedobacter tibetensis]|uniref:thioredoxin domain-containing protein n=1 Tax=Parapedobacter tibetensis TaxID=2972951 RepID=UPI00214D62BD|nr:thioredoxin domain-containing protein [Parapedobacter tibetensis]